VKEIGEKTNDQEEIEVERKKHEKGTKMKPKRLNETFWHIAGREKIYTVYIFFRGDGEGKKNVLDRYIDTGQLLMSM
jgi:hypothetical protein